MTVGDAALKVMAAIGAVIGYGCLIAFLCLIGLQSYRWFREGDWTHFGVADGMSVWLTRCCVKDGDKETCKIAIQTNNVEVDDRGLVYAVDRANTGMHILELTGDARKIGNFAD